MAAAGNDAHTDGESLRRVLTVVLQPSLFFGMSKRSELQFPVK